MADNVEKKQATKRFNLFAAYKQIFGSPTGQKVLHDLMKTHYVMASTFTSEATHETAFKEGERAVVLRILKLTQIDLSQMQKYIEEIEDNASRTESNDPTQW